MIIELCNTLASLLFLMFVPPQLLIFAQSLSVWLIRDFTLWIGYLSRQDGAILSTQDYLLCTPKKMHLLTFRDF